MNRGDDVYAGSDPLDGGKTLRPALVYIHDGVSSTELIYLEIICCGLNPTGNDVVYRLHLRTKILWFI